MTSRPSIRFSAFGAASRSILIGAALVAALNAACAQQAPAPAAVAAPQAVSPQAAALHLRSLAATCANCHGTDGKAPQGSAVVSLAGLPKDTIVAKMKAFKAGAVPATIMHQLSKGYSDVQIEQLAGYFAAQKN